MKKEPTMTLLSRRGLLGSLLAVPAIIRTPGLLMPVKPLHAAEIATPSVWTTPPKAFDMASFEEFLLRLDAYAQCTNGLFVIDPDNHRRFFGDRFRPANLASSETTEGTDENSRQY